MFVEPEIPVPEQFGAKSGEPVRASASLDRWTGARMPVAQFLPLAIRVASELAALHARGAIHQDIRPSSIVFDAATAALALARAQRDSTLAAEIEGRLALYRAGKPYVER